MSNLYNKKDPEDILRYAESLKNKSFYDVLQNNFGDEVLREKVNYYNNPRGKGSLGELLEEHFFYYKPNSESQPDFLEAHTELKVTPYEVNKNGSLRAGERLVITMIPNNEPIDMDFYKSKLIEKIELILLILYKRDRNVNRVDYKIDYVTLFSILSDNCKDDLDVIINDYNTIVDKIVHGKAHELSEADTKYLGACTKGATEATMWQPQYYGDALAKRRAFSLKQSYMTYVINHYIINGISTYDSIFKPGELKEKNFDKEVVNKIKVFVGKTEEELCNQFGVKTTTKNRNNVIVCRMLGVKTDNALEFEKAGIQIKTIRLQKNGIPKESMSFAPIKIKNFVEEDFESSLLYNYFSETRFLFVILEENEKGQYVLSDAKFWNMPITELETKGQEDWLKYKNKFINGVNFTVDRNANGAIRIINDLPKKTETNIFHLRPHAAKSYYVIKGKEFGEGREEDSDLLPNGDRIVKQSFWLNNDYVAKIVK